MKKRILIIVDYYLPGFKGGGPIASVSRIVQSVRDQYDIFILTRDRDLKDSEPYPNLPSDSWIPCEGGHAYYCSPARLNQEGIRTAINSVKPDIVYMNSFFSKTTRIVLALRKLGVVKAERWVVAPRGEFYPGARSIKALKKSVFIPFAKLVRLYNDVVWHVSTDTEGGLVKKTIGKEARYIVVIDPIGPVPTCAERFVPLTKRSRTASFFWISRIAPSKNLDFAIRALKNAVGDVTFTIYGPVEDQEYWSQCQDSIRSLPANVTVNFAGPLTRDQVAEAMTQHHFFLFPTLGENYGHVIAEALSVGRPVLLSDQTPWDDLDATGSGWVIPLDAPAKWAQTIQMCIGMDEDTYARHSRAALRHIEAIHVSTNPEANCEIFESRAA